MTPFGTTLDGWPRVRIDWRPAPAPVRADEALGDEPGAGRRDVEAPPATASERGGTETEAIQADDRAPGIGATDAPDVRVQAGPLR
jgi:hypothetical protein